MSEQRALLSRRALIAIFLLFLLLPFAWILFRTKDVSRWIVEFFGLDGGVTNKISDHLAELRKRQKRGYRETLWFFALDRYHFHFLIPQQLEDRVLGYWSKVLFLRRSIAWPYVHFPAYDDLFVCDGLIRNT